MKTEIMEVHKQEMKKKEGKNKGFSLVELIVVIAIMAILAIVIAPQVMKYIGKSKDSVDATNISLYKTAITTALSDEEIFSEVVTKGTYTFNVTSAGIETKVATDLPEFSAELAEILGGTYPKPQTPGMTKFTITINVKDNKIGKIDVVTAK